MNTCKILLEGQFKQCCCNCKHLAEVRPHTGKKRTGYACIVPALTILDKPNDNRRPWVESPWPLHSEGCEMYSPREDK